jgi:hypothetical protein
MSTINQSRGRLEAYNPGITASQDSLISAKNQFSALLPSKMDLKQFVGLYCPPFYSAIARLTGISDLTTLENLTGNVLFYLWNNIIELSKQQGSGIFIYKTLLQHVFGYLKKEGNKDRIRILRNILPVNPACYLHILEPPKKSFKAIIPSYLLHKIRRIWKTF